MLSAERVSVDHYCYSTSISTYRTGVGTISASQTSHMHILFTLLYMLAI